MKTTTFAAGAELAPTAAGAEVLITMLSDGAAVGLSALRSGAIWIQMSTAGVESCARLADSADRDGSAAAQPVTMIGARG
jgi:3-hydroxyisobutyrate dehydrogenase